MMLTVAQLAQRIGAELIGDGAAKIQAVGPVETAGKSEVTFVREGKHRAALKGSQAGAVILAERIEDLSRPQLIVKNVDVALIEALSIFAPKLQPLPEGIDPRCFYRLWGGNCRWC